MKQFVKDIANTVFSFGGFMFLFIVIAGYLTLRVSAQLDEQKARAAAEKQQVVELCYNQGMVAVATDAGMRCAKPENLVKPS